MRALKRSVPSLTGFSNSIQFRGMYIIFDKSLEPKKNVRNVRKWPNLYSVKL